MPRSDYLPSHVELVRAAGIFLREQRFHWTEWGRTIDDEPIAMAVAFRERFLSAVVPQVEAQPRFGITRLAACYMRSREQSRVDTSLSEQLSEILPAAKRADEFIPWEYVFVDQGGTDLFIPPGLLMMKMSVANEGATAGTVYIRALDDLHRSSLTAAYFGRSLLAAGKNIVGVEDGFDLKRAHKEVTHFFKAYPDYLNIDAPPRPAT